MEKGVVPKCSYQYAVGSSPCEAKMLLGRDRFMKILSGGERCQTAAVTGTEPASRERERDGVTTLIKMVLRTMRT